MSSMAIKGGMIGENIGRSRFSKAFQILCDRDGLSLQFDPFDTKKIPDFHFDDHVKFLGKSGYTAVTVTHPYKTHADARSDQRQGYPASLGAANVLRFDQDGLTSFNTDYTGMIAAWQATFGQDTPGLVAVAGAGGVARAVVAALIELGASGIDIWDVKQGAALALANQIDPHHGIVRAVDASASTAAVLRADGVVNCTPLGMAEYPGMAFDSENIAGRVWAFDAVYTPIETQFMQAAKARRLQRMSGFDLFKHMAVRSYAAYTNTPVNPADTDLLNHLADDP